MNISLLLFMWNRMNSLFNKIASVILVVFSVIQYYRQTADINASETSGRDANAGWLPIGDGSTRFTGTYNGAGYTIVGAFYYGTISQSYSTCSVAGYGVCGGLIGWNDISSVSNCYARGNVTKSSTLSLEYTFGGLVGLVGTSGNAISYCYSTGRVIYAGSTDPTSKGLLGVITGGTTGTSCFWDTQTSLQSTSPGPEIGKTTVQMKTASTFTGWSGSVWKIDGTNTINNGYPFLAWLIADFGSRRFIRV